MNEYRYRILNVFTVGEDRLSGNPLCVFEDGRGLDDRAQQALALQFNLSETTFILPPTQPGATARVRIYTPAFEMPFAGHPTLGTAQVVRELAGAGDSVTLEMKAGLIPVTEQGERWTLRANAPRRRAVEASRAELAQMLGLREREVREGAAWIDTGVEQLIVPLASADVVARCAPDGALLRRHSGLAADRFLVYVWAEAGEGETQVRFFFAKGSAMVEDPATGSACANLGGWHVLAGTPLPLARRLRQGHAVGRPSELFLDVESDKTIRVGGRVIELGRGTVRF
jgi:trans-2,3-dihydro-3-hydroxyanthranilate isomerase